jgi:uncharacterized membrane protein
VNGSPASDGSSTTGLDPNVASALAYLAGPVSGILVLMSERRNATVRFHAWQSIIALGSLGVLVALLILGAFVSIVVSAGLFKFLLYAGWSAWIAWIVLWLICLVKAYQGQRWKLPLVGEYIERKEGTIPPPINRIS